MTAFVCEACHAENGNGLVRYSVDRYVIEVAAKRADGNVRAAQVSTHKFCLNHAVAYVELVRRGGADLPPATEPML